MTTRRLILLLCAAAIKLAWLLTAPASGGEVRQVRRTTRITVLKPIRAQGRAHAGYPFLQTTANCTRVIANVTGLLNPIGWFLR